MSASILPALDRKPPPKRSTQSLASEPKRRRTSYGSGSSISSHSSSSTDSSVSVKSAPPEIDLTTEVARPLRPEKVPPVAAAKGATLASTNEARVEERYNLAVQKLGTLVTNTVQNLQAAPDWETFVQQEHGPSHLRENLQELPHPAGPFLASLQEHGTPVAFDDEPWTLEQMDAVVAKGCHPTAQKHAAFIAEEMLEFAESGYWIVLPYSVARGLPELRGSAAHIKEELNRKARFLADHSVWGINEHTLPLTPKEAMQFGGTLPRILYLVRHADPKYGPVYLAKFDLKDGFYHLHVRPRDAPALAVVLPCY